MSTRNPTQRARALYNSALARWINDPDPVQQKGCGFNAQSGHVQEATDQRLCLSVSLPTSSLSEINKYILR